MKYPLFILLLLANCVYAQKPAGLITYEETVKFQIDLGEDVSDALLANFPKNKTDYAELLFNSSESLYRSAKETDSKKTGTQFFSGDDGAQIEIKMKRSENFTYNNLTTNDLTEQKEFMGRTFLIQGELEPKRWKLSNETKDILGYTCQKATYSENSSTYVAWYTTQIPYSIGPSKFSGLPGAMLEVTINDDERTYIAQSIDLEKDYGDEIKPPRKGKSVSRKEFEKIKEEKLKEMEEEYGGSSGSGGVRVFIQKN